MDKIYYICVFIARTLPYDVLTDKEQTTKTVIIKE